MNSKLFNDIKTLNELNLVSYFNILGFKPVAEHPHSTDYQVLLDDIDPTTLTVDHRTNRFQDKANNRGGTLVDFACLLFQCTSIELCSNLMPYQLDRLLQLTQQTT
jgi:hypothetical protein